MYEVNTLTATSNLESGDSNISSEHCLRSNIFFRIISRKEEQTTKVVTGRKIVK